MDCKIVTVGTYKGGVGKTTAAAALAYYIYDKTGKNVLAVDLDAQGSLSLIMGVRGRINTVMDVIKGKHVKPRKVTEGVFIIPAAPDFYTEGRIDLLFKAIREDYSSEFDYIVLDLPPEIKSILENAAGVSDYVLIPVMADITGLQGLFQSIATVRARMQHVGVFVNAYDGRAIISRKMREAIIEAAESEGAEYLGEVRRGVAVSNAAALRESIFDCESRSNPAKDFRNIFEHVLKEIMHARHS